MDSDTEGVQIAMHTIAHLIGWLGWHVALMHYTTNVFESKDRSWILESMLFGVDRALTPL
jgi:hypothetical protein